MAGNFFSVASKQCSHLDLFGHPHNRAVRMHSDAPVKAFQAVTSATKAKRLDFRKNGEYKHFQLFII
jgi:hypothetical protein